MKLTAFLICAALIIFGLIKGGEPFILAGAVVYLSLEVIDLVILYRSAKLFRTGQWEPNEKKRTPDRIAQIIRNLILFAGLIGTVTLRDKTNAYAISGAMIWIGTIVCWLIAGWITKGVAGMPLKMGYGGWSVDRSEKRRNRRRS